MASENKIFENVLRMPALDEEWTLEEQTEEHLIFKGAFGHAEVKADGRIVSQVTSYVAALEAAIKGEELPVKPKAGRSQDNKAIVPSTLRKPVNGHVAQSNGILTPRDIIDYINPKATEQEAYLFCEFCKRKGADPMTKQVYLVVYVNDKGERNVSFIAGKEYFTEKAEAHPQFDGFRAGIITRPRDGGELIHREGTFYLPSEETLLGGWSEVCRKDRKVPIRAEVVMAEYNTDKAQWKKMPGTMIRKVAIVQALREAFPANLGGMYDSSEMNQAGIADIDPDMEVKT
ncbi:phage recombination protein Bet [Candidatus Pacearchaeota archaeon]|jgi:phage recombination protein Bet|nr:phage recombination protein Bet [Candidatus Pacearchaeota archaeon]